MKSREQYKQELDALSQKLRERGVIDIKFTVPEPGTTFEQMADDVLLVVGGLLDGKIKSTPFTGFGDSVRITQSQQSFAG